LIKAHSRYRKET